MYNKIQTEVKGRGFKRKTSLGLVCGISLMGAMFLGANGVSADEVKAPTDAKLVATATTETPKATTEAPKQEVQAETKEAPKTEEVKDQAGLDTKYSDLKEKGKELDVELTEDKKVTHKTVADASKDLDEQGKKVEELAKGRDEANVELQKVVKEAKDLGIDVKLDEKVMYDDLDKAKEDIAKQVKELSALVTSVKEAKTRLSKAVTTAQSVGVKIEGVKNIDLKEGNLEALAKEVADAEKALNEVVAQQKAVSAELNKAIADAKAKGVDVTVDGEIVVEPKDAQKALADAKAKITKALDDAEAKNKTIRQNNAKVNEANKNAKAELVNGSTATKNADGTYTQTLAVKNEKAGSKWSGNLANTGSAELVSVKLVSPTGKETVFTNGKIDSSKTLDEVGDYKLVYTFKAKDNNVGNVLGKLSVEGQAGYTDKAIEVVPFKVSNGKVPIVKITVGGNGVTVTKAILKGATTKDLAIKDGKVDFSEKLVDGKYTVEFEATGKGTVTTAVAVEGEELIMNFSDTKSIAGSKGSSIAKEDKLQPSKLGSTTNEVKPEAVKVANITLKAQKPQVGKAEAKAHEVGVSAKVHHVDVEKKPEVKPEAKPEVKPEVKQEVKQEVKPTTNVLPNTGSTDSVALAMVGVGLLSLAGVSLKKKKD